MSSALPRTIAITGAARGIGRALAAMFAGAGDQVFALDIDAVLLEEASVEIGPGVVPLTADVSDRASVDAAFAAIGRAGGLDVLVNNAATVQAARFEEITQASWDSVIGVNLTGTFNCCQAAWELLRDGGRIVNLSSHSGSLGSLARGAYAASKAGVDGLTRVLAVEAAPRGITVNAVAPGPVDTPHARGAHSDARRAAWAEALLVKRYATEEEIAGTVRFLASPEAGFITGQIIHVDGGMTVRGLTASS